MGVELRKTGIAIGTSCTHAFMEGEGRESHSETGRTRQSEKEMEEGSGFDVTISRGSLISCF